MPSRMGHSEEYSWKEVRDGIKAVGILEMEIYILGSKLVMIVDAPADFQWDEAMARLATLPRQAEWEAFVSKFQGCPADARSDENGSRWSGCSDCTKILAISRYKMYSFSWAQEGHSWAQEGQAPTCLSKKKISRDELLLHTKCGWLRLSALF